MICSGDVLLTMVLARLGIYLAGVALGLVLGVVVEAHWGVEARVVAGWSAVIRRWRIWRGCAGS